MNDFAVPEGGARIPLSKSFHAIKNVAITIQDIASSNAVYAKIQDKLITGPRIIMYDKDHNTCAGLIDATIQGY